MSPVIDAAYPPRSIKVPQVFSTLQANSALLFPDQPCDRLVAEVQGLHGMPWTLGEIAVWVRFAQDVQVRLIGPVADHFLYGPVLILVRNRAVDDVEQVAKHQLQLWCYDAVHKLHDGGEVSGYRKRDVARCVLFCRFGFVEMGSVWRRGDGIRVFICNN